jgi:hypothetical protein
VGDDRRAGDGQERPHDAEGEDAAGRAAEPRGADAEAAVEEDDDQGDRDDPLDGLLLRLRHPASGHCCSDEEERGGRHAQPLRQAVRLDGQEPRAGGGEDERAEADRVVHVSTSGQPRAVPTRLPGAPLRSLRPR